MIKNKIIKTVVLMLTIISFLSACGKGAISTKTTSEKVNSSETLINEIDETKETKAKDKEDYNWVGVLDRYGFRVTGEGKIAFDILYPTLSPTSSGCTYQKDASLVLITTPGLDGNYQAIKVSNLENTLEESKPNIIMDIERYRGGSFKNLDFVVETQELMTINDLEMCKYTGKHTYTLDGNAQEIPFVAYAVDTKQVSNFYPIIIVMDDSINHASSMEALAEGTIEIYAKKMAESIVISE